MYWCGPRRKMSRVAKVIALVVLAAFLPSSILSAAPVVWCVAGDDHAAIEISIAKRQHAQAGQAGEHHVHAADAAHAPRDKQPDPCFDYDLIGSALQTGTVHLDTPALGNAVSCVTPTQARLHRTILPSATAIRSPPSKRSVSAGLLELRTIKLRL